MAGSGQYVVGKVPFRIGVEYRPASAAPELWRHFDIDEIQEDFCSLAQMGANLVRVTLPWGELQTDRSGLGCRALAHLLNLCDAAASEGIRIELLLFGAPLEVPGWLGHNDALATPVAQQSAVAFAQSIARTVGAHPAVWSYHVGLPLAQLPHESRHRIGLAWLDQLSHAIREIDPRHAITCGLGRDALTSKTEVRVDEICSMVDHSTVDCGGLIDELGDDEAGSRAAFGCALTTALTGKPCLLQQREVVAPERTGSTRAILAGLHLAGAVGVMMDGDELHAHADAIKAFAKTKPVVQQAANSPVNLCMTNDEYYLAPRKHLHRLYGEFRAWLDSA